MQVVHMNKPREPLRSLLSYTPEEKCKIFDDLYTQAKAVFELVTNNERAKDKEQYAFESLMELLGPSVWDVLRDFDDVD